METFEKTPGLKDEMIVTQTDIWHDAKNESGSQFTDVAFIAAMEHKHYPIYTSMYHPEYQASMIPSLTGWSAYENRANAEEIGFRISLMLNREARKNSNRINVEY